jgi:Tc toxin complex TcA C-terminal TcB-binding domain
VAYLDQNQREYEITKHVSLSKLDPLALAQLKQTGECFVSVPEALFDLDYAGHYLRRIKYASMTVPCVTGP